MNCNFYDIIYFNPINLWGVIKQTMNFIKSTINKIENSSKILDFGIKKLEYNKNHYIIFNTNSNSIHYMH